MYPIRTYVAQYFESKLRIYLPSFDKLIQGISQREADGCPLIELVIVAGRHQQLPPREGPVTIVTRKCLHKVYFTPDFTYLCVQFFIGRTHKSFSLNTTISCSNGNLNFLAQLIITTVAFSPSPRLPIFIFALAKYRNTRSPQNVYTISNG